MKINLALCCDDNFVIPTLVCLTSVFENDNGSSFDVYIVTAGISIVNEEKFQKLSKLYGHSIKIIKISAEISGKFHTRGRYAYATYFRYYLPDIINADKVIYLDGDIIVRHDIEELWNFDIDDFACAAVEDQRCSDVTMYNRFYLETAYFNAGVLLINLKYWRCHNISEKLIKYTIKNKDLCFYQDQDALNVVLSGQVLYLPYNFNFQELWYLDEKSNPAHFSKWSEIRKFKDSPFIIHYCVSEKPWFYECKHPLRNEWIKYAKMHTFIGYQNRRKYSFFYRLLCKLIYGIGIPLLNKIGK